MASPVLHCFEEYQKARISFVQTIAELSTHQQNVEALYSAGVMSLLKPLLLDVVPSIQQSAALAIGRLANYSVDLSRSVAENDIIPQLTYSLPKQNRFFKKAACYILKSVSQHSVELAQMIVNAGALEPLVLCLDEFDPSVKEAAAFALGHIAKHNENLARQVVEARAVDSLLLCLQEPELILKRVASQTLANICKHTEQLAQPVAENGLDVICSYVNYTDTAIKRNVCNLLANICKHSNELATLVMSKLTNPQKLVNCLKDPDEIVKQNAAMCIGEIVNKSPECAQEICNAGAPLILVNYIANSKASKKLYAIISLGYMAGYSERTATMLINANALEVLKHSLENDLEQVKCACCFALNLIGRHSAQHANEVVNSGVLKTMLFYYMDKKTGDDLKEKAKKAIIEIIKKCSNLNNLEPLLHVSDRDILSPVLNQYATYLKDNQTELSNFARNGGLNKVLSIKRTLNEPLLHLANEICSYYPAEIINYYNPEYAKILLDKIGVEDSAPKEEENKEEDQEEINNKDGKKDDKNKGVNKVEKKGGDNKGGKKK
jgi:HEAT repeat protein